MHRRPLTVRRNTRALVPITVGCVLVGLLATGNADAAATPSHAYRAHDYADGQAMSILPPGENGLVNATDAITAEAGGPRPAGSQDQLGKYADLIYGAPNLTDAGLGQFFDDESFGVRAGQITRTETPGPGVTVYRDTHDVPHVYGTSDQTMAFGAGFVQAEDRLFLMDVLRHYGSGTLAAFLGPTCEFEQMDHDQLLLAPYTPAQAQAQIDALPAEYGADGKLAKSVIGQYVAGVNAYITLARTNPQYLPADYAGATPNTLPQPWTEPDVVAVAGLIGGIFGKGGGAEVANSQLLTYLKKTLGNTAGAAAFAQFKTADDPLAPTTATTSFPYEHPGTVDPSTTAIPDSATLTGGPESTSTGCGGSSTTPAPPTGQAATATSIIDGLKAMPSHMSNALVVDATHSATGHPVAVFGPQVSYFAPQILTEIDLHSPTYDAEGASFPGTGIVELGRGQDYAWSATSAGSDLIDQRLEIICKPGGGTPDPQGAYYLFNGRCLPMTHESFDETAVPTPGGQGVPAQLHHDIYLTRHGVVQGWTTAGGKPVAVVTQRSTYNHEVDSIVGFFGWGRPSVTHDVNSWLTSAAKIQYTFNWLYADNRDIGYFVSGRDPIRPSNVDPSLPTWGDGRSEWQGFLSAAKHVHQVNPAQGYFVSWNNKPAPGFSAADDQYGYGQVYRSQMLTAQLKAALARGPITRAGLVQVMEAAATQDLDGLSVVPLLLQEIGNRAEPAGVAAMLDQLRSWSASGAHRKKNANGDSEYASAAAVAISDELIPRLIQAFYDPILKAGGLGSVGSTGGAQTSGYSVLPMQWVNTPNSGGAHLGSAYDGGYEGYLVSTLEQLLGQHPADGFGTAITSRECAGGPSTCPATIDAALQDAYDALVQANGSSDVSSWTASTDSKAAGQPMPQFDAIHFRALGIVGQPDIDWQNRPTFQQVIQFSRHRPR
ncbi:MAG: penicillin acylase family protein [Blastococcus sp.]